MLGEDSPRFVERGPGELPATETYRADFRTQHIPAWYRGELHVAWTAAWVLGPVLYCSLQLRAVQPLELFTIPAMVVLGSWFVWSFHKHVLHRPRLGLRRAYEIHTLQHHRFYTFEHNEPGSSRDFYITLFPPSFGPGLALASYLVGHYVVSAITLNVGTLFTIVSVVYFGLYELVHFASHLPASAPILRCPFLRKLRVHHRLHHDPRLMGKHNFNVVLPLFDWVFGTLVRSGSASREKVR